MPALRGDLFENLALGVQSLEEGEPVEPDMIRHRLYQLGQRRRRVPVERHVVAVGEVAEQLRPRFPDVVGMLEQAVGVYVRLPDLALGSVVAHRSRLSSGTASAGWLLPTG
jgi:hypothetical protein